MRENIKKYYDYLLSLLDKDQYLKRRDIVYKHLEKTLHDGYITVYEKPRSPYLPFDYTNDLPMYYLVQLELFLGSYVEYDAAFIARVYPKINQIGRMLELLKNVENFKQKNIKLLRKNNKSVENDLFEICTATVYIKNGYKEIEFIPEKKDNKTPDLKADQIYIECKRKVKECDYSIEERKLWYQQFDPVSAFFRENNLSLVIEVDFKRELNTYSKLYLYKIVRQMFDVYRCNNYRTDDISIKIRHSNIDLYNTRRHSENIRMDKPLFNETLYNFDSKKGGITTLLKLSYDKGLYKVSPHVSYAAGGIWFSSSTESFINKAVSIRKNIEKALKQIPSKHSSNIHICYESYENQEVEQRIIEKALRDINTLNLEEKILHNIFLHILRPENSNTEDSIYEETVVVFQKSDRPQLLEKLYIFGDEKEVLFE